MAGPLPNPRPSPGAVYAHYVGQRLTLFCLNYIYTGTLVGVTDHQVILNKAAIVYETGPFNEKDWKDAQELPHDWHVNLSCVESFGLLKE